MGVEWYFQERRVTSSKHRKEGRFGTAANCFANFCLNIDWWCISGCPADDGPAPAALASVPAN